MTNINHWLLPEGIDEVLPPQAWRLEQLRRSAFDMYRSWGYELFVPPLIEFLEPLLSGTGNDLDLQTFKLTDQLTGRMMGIRADITPQAARIDAHQLRREEPVRLFYLGTVLHTRPDGFAGSRAPMQIGAELFGHAGVESDIEILLLMLETLAVTGIRDNLHLDIGHVGIFRSLAQEAGLDSAQQSALFDALQRKALPEIDAIVDTLKATDQQKKMIASLAELHGSVDEIDRAREMLKEAGSSVQEALDDMQSVANAVHAKWPELPVYFDLAELRGFKYHTGILFAAFIAGVGQEIARGGRYDDVGRVFGRARPATGFSADLKTLMQLGGGGGSEELDGILAPVSDQSGLSEAIDALRSQGERVVCELPGQGGTQNEFGCDRVLVYEKGKWQVVARAANT